MNFDQIHQSIHQNPMALLTTEDLLGKITTLKKLCVNIDPFALKESDSEALNDLGIVDQTNPFAITNQLVLLLEEYQEEISKRHR